MWIFVVLLLIAFVGLFSWVKTSKIKSKGKTATDGQLIDDDMDEEDLSIMNKTMNCSVDMISAETAYCQMKGLKDLTPSITKPAAIIDRWALIFAVLSVMFKNDIYKRIYALELIDTMIKYGPLTPKEKDGAICRFEERYKYFADEIEVEMQCSFFMPTALIYTLRHPDEKPTRDASKVGPVDAITQWGIILKVIKQYFNDNDKKQ